MRKLVLGLVALVAFAATVAWFWTQGGPRGTAPMASTPTASLPEIVIGLGAPLSGERAGFGEQLRIGAEFAVEVINGNGGIEGRKVRLLVRDDACDGDRARAVAAEFVAAKAAGVIGHFCSAASAAAAEVYGPAGTVMVTPASSDPRLTQGAPAGTGLVFRTVWRDDYQGLIAAALVKQTLAGKKIGVVRDGTLYGLQVATTFKAAAAKLDLPVPAADLELGSALAPKAAAAKLKSAGVGVVFLAAAPAAAGPLVKALREAGVTASIIGPDSLASPEFGEAAGKAADGAIVTFARNPLDYPTAAKAVERLLAARKDPSGYALNAFAAIEVVTAALRLEVKPDPAAAIDGKRLAATIRVNRFSTVLGEMSFDAHGDLTKPGVVYYVWKGGKLTVM
ncbi:branched-chain amino acid ABC transporter substrate-binding protein [Zavarzinia compransoris]|uniref:Leucine-binding protein domain-containing protein n=1 Tax=Zavarzinia compransoris TaxID=1264899 RepID=A0A317DYE0_9PROT|nr:branched-chain amino acid ABC transporter substrate-binding protein [Zavarzinia compransoris]PWR18950.1 hypothetical protein DKG75_18445 [Zavarzinia compransoris]TDP48950.1 amino acid/amide ABC transporter substrate-binding protein (HAAT family) [Zavarzinia compransoris]